MVFIQLENPRGKSCSRMLIFFDFQCQFPSRQIDIVPGHCSNVILLTINFISPAGLLSKVLPDPAIFYIRFQCLQSSQFEQTMQNHCGFQVLKSETTFPKSQKQKHCLTSHNCGVLNQERGGSLKVICVLHRMIYRTYFLLLLHQFTLQHVNYSTHTKIMKIKLRIT